MMQVMPSPGITLRDWYEKRAHTWPPEGKRPVSFHAVKQWQAWRPDFPRPVWTAPPNTHFYRLADLDRWKRKHPDLGTAREDR